MSTSLRAGAGRGHAAYGAFLVHRISGVALALFLPMHFYVLGTALESEARLETWISWTHQPLVVAAEWVLVTLLAAHLAGGLRLLVLEFLPWRDWQKTLAAVALAFALACGLAFALAR
jgi:fumarate reductase subunit D